MLVEKFDIHGQNIEVSDAYAREQIGDEVLMTNAKTLKGAINELIGAGGSSVSIVYNEEESSLIFNNGGDE